MPLITFLTLCYQETGKQTGGDLLIEWDASRFLPTPAAGLSPEAEISWQWGLDGEILADPLPGVTDGCGICGGSHGSVGPQSLSSSLKYLVIFLCKDKWLCSTQDSACYQLSPPLFFLVGGWPCPWRTSKLQFKGSEAATGQTAASLKRLPACIAHEHTVLPSTPWENILTQAFIGDHSSLPIY